MQGEAGRPPHARRHARAPRRVRRTGAAHSAARARQLAPRWQAESPARRAARRVPSLLRHSWHPLSAGQRAARPAATLRRPPSPLSRSRCGGAARNPHPFCAKTTARQARAARPAMRPHFRHLSIFRKFRPATRAPRKAFSTPATKSLLSPPPHHIRTAPHPPCRCTSPPSRIPETNQPHPPPLPPPPPPPLPLPSPFLHTTSHGVSTRGRRQLVPHLG